MALQPELAATATVNLVRRVVPNSAIPATSIDQVEGSGTLEADPQLKPLARKVLAPGVTASRFTIKVWA